jgi:SAM-dependent methyltransferase
VIEYIKKINRKEQFNPSLIGIFINASYFIKRGIYTGIKTNAHNLKGKLLDFGCGNKPYKSLFVVEQYIGIDIENKAHNHDKESIDLIYDGKNIPFENEHFDSIFASEVFEHVFNLEEVLLELNRILKKDGVILITLPFVWYQHEKPNDFARYTEFGIKYLLEKSNFEIIIHEKSSSWFETIIQLWNSYLYETIFPRNNFLKLVLCIIFITPFNLIGIIGEWLFPKNYDLYLNHIILAKKTANKIS